MEWSSVKGAWRFSYLLAVGVLSIALINPTSSAADPPPPPTQSEISFVGPTVRELPTELEFLSPSPHLTAGFSCHTGSYPGPIEPCDAYLIAFEGPDPSGLYHFRFNLPTAAPGEVHIEAISPTPNPLDGDRLVVTFTATTSGISFGDVRTCLMPGTNAQGQAAFELGYYSQVSSTAVVFRQERIGGRWTAPKLKALANYPVGGTKGVEPYTRRTIRFHVPASTLARRQVRLLYFVMKGNHPTISPKQRARAFRKSRPPGGRHGRLEAKVR